MSISPEQLKELYVKRWGPVVFAYLLDWTIIISSFCVVGHFQSVWVAILLLPIIANRQYAITIFGHDGAHYLVSENKKLNDFVTQVFFFLPMGVSLHPYRNFHLKHHRYVNTLQDPEFAHLSHFRNEWSTPMTKMKLAKIVASDILLFGAIKNLVHIVQLTGPKKPNEIIPVVLFQTLAHGTLWLTGLWWVSLMWTAGVAFFFWPMYRLRLWVEHKATPYTHRVHLSPFVQFLIAPHNLWVHYEHHESVAVPFYNLRKYRDQLKDGIDTLSLKEHMRYLAVTHSEVPAYEDLIISGTKKAA